MTRDGKIGVAVRGWPVAPRLLFIAAFLSFCGAAHAADWASGTPSPAAGGDPANFGVACSIGAPIWSPPVVTAEDLPWASVWLGHFSGGRRYADGYGRTLVDWRDEKLCFSSRRQCQVWVRDQRHAYHRPEGYWTCLLLR